MCNGIRKCFQLSVQSEQLFIPLFSFGDVVKEYSNLEVLRFSKSKSINVIPPLQLFSTIFETNRFACQSNFSIDLKPMFFMIGSKLAHSFSNSIMEPCLF